MVAEVWVGLDLSPIMISMAAHVLCYFSINACCAETIVLIFHNILKIENYLWVIIFVVVVVVVVVIAISK